jgi:hypothetical protein
MCRSTGKSLNSKNYRHQGDEKDERAEETFSESESYESMKADEYVPWLLSKQGSLLTAKTGN